MFTDYFIISPEGLGLGQLLFLLLGYGYILATGSSAMAQGADYLLYAAGPSWAGPIGGILIPILGALPDSVMIAMSGLGEGTAEELQASLQIGCGTLVGSTIMLLTIPSAIGLFLSARQLGGVPLRAQHQKKIRHVQILNTVTGKPEDKEIVVLKPMVPQSYDLFTVGATALSSTPKGAKVMMMTSVTYLFLQIPVLLWGNDRYHRQHYFVLAGFIFALSAFFGYLWWAYTDSDALEVVSEKQRRLEDSWNVTNGLQNMQHLLKSSSDPFLESDTIFRLFDINGNGSIDFDEMKQGWKRIGYQFNNEDAEQSFYLLDTDHDGYISRKEFNNWLEDYLLPQYINSTPIASAASQQSSQRSTVAPVTVNNDADTNTATTQTIPNTTSFQQAVTTLTTIVPKSTSDKIVDFLQNPTEQTISFILSKDQRYALHVWASAQNQLDVALITHSEDVPPDMKMSEIDEDTLNLINIANDIHDTTQHIRKLTITKQKKSNTSQAKAGRRPELRPLIAGVPAWACASESLLNAFYSYQSSSSQKPSSAFRSVVQKFTHGSALDLPSVQRFVREYRLGLTSTAVNFLFYTYDTDRDQFLNVHQFRLLLESLVETAPNTLHNDDITNENSASLQQRRSGLQLEQQGDDDDDDHQPVRLGMSSDADSGSADGGEDGDEEEEEEEEEEENKELAHLSNTQVLQRSVLLLAIGTFIVICFSDPMVEVIGELGNKMGIPAFYISFIVTPLASNASEIIASLNFAAKKTDVTFGLTLSSLYGAATMNNTICLSVFMAIIFFRQLTWDHTAETVTVLFVTYTVGIIGLKQTLQLWKGIVLLSLFPISLGLILLLNNYLV